MVGDHQIRFVRSEWPRRPGTFLVRYRVYFAVAVLLGRPYGCYATALTIAPIATNRRAAEPDWGNTTSTLKSAGLLLFAALWVIGPGMIGPAAAQRVTAGTVEALIGTAVVTRYGTGTAERLWRAPRCSRAIAFAPTWAGGSGSRYVTARS